MGKWRTRRTKQLETCLKVASTELAVEADEGAESCVGVEQNRIYVEAVWPGSENGCVGVCLSHAEERELHEQHETDTHIFFLPLSRTLSSCLDAGMRSLVGGDQKKWTGKRFLLLARSCH